jgi:hypothetical protein
VSYDNQLTSSQQHDKTASRTIALTDPNQHQLVDQLLDNLESGDPQILWHLYPLEKIGTKGRVLTSTLGYY